MSVPFAQSLRSVSTDAPRTSLFAATSSLLALSATVAWLFVARVSVYVTTDKARVESIDKPHRVDAPVAGAIVKNELALGRKVHAGDVLVELDATVETLRRDELVAKLSALPAELAALRTETESQSGVVAADRVATSAAVVAANARLREAELEEKHAQNELARGEKLFASGAITDLELAKLRIAKDQATAIKDSRAREAIRLEAELKARAGDVHAKTDALAREIAVVDATRVSLVASIATLDREIERRTIRAAIDGVVAEYVATSLPGAHVDEGATLATLVPEHGLQVVAQLAPDGRVTPGQPAHLRVDAFPWAQFGTVTSTVTAIGSEPRDGVVRVELALADVPKTIALRHGLTGTLEIETERVSPAKLLLRGLGEFFSRPTPR